MMLREARCMVPGQVMYKKERGISSMEAGLPAISKWNYRFKATLFPRIASMFQSSNQATIISP